MYLQRLVIFLSIALLGGCGASESRTDQSSELDSLGSWSTAVGGSLAEWQEAQVASVRAVTFYRVYRPVGLGIVHEYLGLDVRMENGNVVRATTGLVGEGDQEYFVQELGRSNRAALIKGFVTVEDSQQAIHSLNAAMRRSPFHNRAYYLSAMTATPLLGRPCARVARKLATLVLDL